MVRLNKFTLEQRGGQAILVLIMVTQPAEFKENVLISSRELCGPSVPGRAWHHVSGKFPVLTCSLLCYYFRYLFFQSPTGGACKQSRHFRLPKPISCAAVHYLQLRLCLHQVRKIIRLRTDTQLQGKL